MFLLKHKDIKYYFQVRCQWLTLVILATWAAEMGDRGGGAGM
jgi:hypothetical protein